MKDAKGRIRGRGAASNPRNRFDKLTFEPDPESAPEFERPRTVYYKDTTRSVLTTNESPDVGFDASVNPYRGCEHGCIYCYARPTHEYLGFSAGLDFETRILVKESAPALLRRKLKSPAWQPKSVAMSGVTDPYQPIERRLGLTRACLEVLRDFLNPVIVITKNHLVTRDADILQELGTHDAAAVFVSVTTLDAELARRLEPRTSTPERRLAAIAQLTNAGVPTGVLVAPIIPGLTDHEVPAIIEQASGAGAAFAGYTTVRLPHGVAGLFENWLDANAPEHKDKVLGRIRSLRGGRLNDPRFRWRMKGQGPFAKQISDLFAISCRRAGIAGRRPVLSTEAFRRSAGDPPSLFD